MNAGAHPYSKLEPALVLDALDTVGLRGDGRLLSLNSYENRVYQVYLEEGGSIVTKFYRPERWTDDEIAEEHSFALELAGREVPVVAPKVIGGRTLHHHEGFRFAVYERRGGRPPMLDKPEVLEFIGRFLGRIHAVGAVANFEHRPDLDPDTFGTEPRNWLLDHGHIPEDLRESWTSIADLALDAVEAAWESAGDFEAIRLHGDCHPGNILYTDPNDGAASGSVGPHFVDLDDARMGPPVQDLWMLLSGDRASQTKQLKDVLAGYEQFRPVDRRELALVEALRTLRLLHYSAWIARRWHDPAFPAAFPWFGTTRYWQDRILELREQVAAMEEAPLDPK